MHLANPSTHNQFWDRYRTIVGGQYASHPDSEADLECRHQRGMVFASETAVCSVLAGQYVAPGLGAGIGEVEVC